MAQKLESIVINERETEPLSEYVIDFLFNLNKECAYLDYKWFLDFSTKSDDFIKTIKHFLAFANHGGGWLLLGWKQNEQNKAIPEGLPETYYADQSIIQEKINSYIDQPMEVHYKEFEKYVDSCKRRYAIIFIPPSTCKLVPNKDGIIRYQDGKERIVFRKGDLFFRRGSQSIIPSSSEMSLIEERICKEDYRLSVLSGEPDDITETLYSNLFPLVKYPKWVYLAKKKDYDSSLIHKLLKQEKIFPYWIPKYREYENNIVIFENLEEPTNSYRKLVDTSTIKKESFLEWLIDTDKKRVVVSLLNKEMIHYCINHGLYYFKNKNKFFYPCEDSTVRYETWISKSGRKSTRQVANKAYASQLNQSVYYHHCFDGSFIEIDDTDFCYQIVPSFLLTTDGKKPISSFEAGTFITRLAYSQYNDKYLNNILFWRYKLSEGESIVINDYIEISPDPLTVKLNKGIMTDLPSNVLSEDEDGDYS